MSCQIRMIRQVQLQDLRMMDFSIVQNHMHRFTRKRLADRVEECHEGRRRRLFRLRYQNITRRGCDGAKEGGRGMMTRGRHRFLLTAEEPGGTNRRVRPDMGCVFEDDHRIGD